MQVASLDDLRRLTRATHASKVCRVLAAAGVPYRLDAAGQPIVLAAAVQRAFGGGPDTATATAIDIDIDARLARLKRKV